MVGGGTRRTETITERTERSDANFVDHQQVGDGEEAYDEGGTGNDMVIVDVGGGGDDANNQETLRGGVGGDIHPVVTTTAAGRSARSDAPAAAVRARPA